MWNFFPSWPYSNRGFKWGRKFQIKINVKCPRHYKVCVVSLNSAPTLSFFLEIHLAQVGLSSVKSEKGGGLADLNVSLVSAVKYSCTKLTLYY